MYCHNCGHRNPEGSNFCSACGATLQPDSQADTTITFMPEGESEPGEEVSIPVDELEEGKAIVVIRKGPEAGTRFTLDKDLVTCGRSPASDIFLDDVTVSRKHAEITRDESGFRIHDVGSLNGTFVNRERVEKGPLSNGDEVQIGKFRLVFFTEGAPSV
ncbi:MAG: FHA domain-containing protein [Actinobacteria bacterium]|nr:FHA domain-containing protein [Actinomycetota bacterium]